MVNWVLSIAYASLFAKLFRLGIHSRVPLFSATLAFSSLYMVAFEQAINWPAVSIPMAVLRLLALSESVFLVFRDKDTTPWVAQHAALQAVYTQLQLATLYVYPFLTIHPVKIGDRWIYPVWETGRIVYAFGCLLILLAYHAIFKSQSEAAEAAEVHPPVSDQSGGSPEVDR